MALAEILLSANTASGSGMVFMAMDWLKQGCGSENPAAACGREPRQAHGTVIACTIAAVGCHGMPLRAGGLKG